MSDESQLAFVATMRDEASAIAGKLRTTLRELAGTRAAVAIPLEVKDEASAALKTVDEQLAHVGEAAKVAADESKAASAQIGKSFGDAAGKVGAADAKFAAAGKSAGTATARGFSSAATTNAERDGHRFGSVFGRATLGPLRSYGEIALGFFALDKISSFVRGSVADARDAQQQQRLLAQVIKTTGGVANVTASDLNTLAQSIMRHTGIDDDAVVASGRLLLTFTNVRNEVGKGNAIFNQAVRQSQNLATALGTDASGAALQLGKALNDPVRGLTLLGRAGVSFNATETATIKAAVAAGKTLKAQKVILGEVKTEFGGAAKAAVTSGDKLKTAFGNVREELGTALFSALHAVESNLGGRLVPILNGLPGKLSAIKSSVSKFAGEARPAVEQVVHAVGDIIVSVKNVVVALKPLEIFTLAAVLVAFRTVAAVIAPLASTVRELTGFFADNRTAALILSAVLGTLLVRQAALLAAALVKIILTNIDGFIVGLAFKVAAANAAFVAAEGGVRGLGAALKALNVNPVMLALTAVATVATFMWARDAKATREAQKAADDYVQSLGATKTSLASVDAAIANLDVRDIFAQVDASGLHGSAALKEIGDLVKAREDLVKQGAAMRANEQNVATSMGTTTAAVEKLAQGYNIDLSGPLPAVRAQLEAAAKAVALTHHPAAQAAADVKSLGDKASTTADDVQKLTDELNLMAGDFLTADQGLNAFASDVDALDKALKKSKGSLDRHSTASIAARDALDTAAQQTLSNAAAEEKLKNGTAKATKTLTDEIAVLQKHAGNSGYAKRAVAELEAALAKIPGTGASAASGLISSSGKIKKAAQDSANATVAALAAGNQGARRAGVVLGSAFGRALGGQRSTLRTTASNVASVVDQGLAAGIGSSSGIAAVVNAAINVVNLALNAAKHSPKGAHASSPSKRGIAIGATIPDGLVVGLDRGRARVAASAVKLVGTVSDLIGKQWRHERAGIVRDVGHVMRDMTKALEAGVPDTRSAIRSIAHTLRSDVGDAVRALNDQAKQERQDAKTAQSDAKQAEHDAKGEKSSKKRDALLANAKRLNGKADALNTDAKKLAGRADDLRRRELKAIAADEAFADRADRLAKRRSTVAGRLANARAKLQSIIDDRKALVSSVRDSVNSLGDLTDITPPNDAPVTAGFITQGLGASLATARRFLADMRKLGALGLGKTALAQIFAKGPAEGTAYAEALIAGGSDAISQVNSLQSQLGDVAKQTGDLAGVDLYASGQKAAQGLVDGLKSKLDAIDKIATELGKRIAKALRKELGIHSPSRVGHDIGRFMPLGIAQGIAAGSYHAEAAAAKMAARVANAATPDLAAAGGVAGMSITRSVNFAVEIRHRVTFDQPAVAAQLSASQVADLIARDPQSAAKLERALTPQRGKIAARLITASD